MIFLSESISDNEEEETTNGNEVHLLTINTDDINGTSITYKSLFVL